MRISPHSRTPRRGVPTDKQSARLSRAGLRNQLGAMWQGFLTIWKNFVGDLMAKGTVGGVATLLHPEFDRRYATAAVILAAAGCLPAAMAATAPKAQEFNLPADAAARTL